MTEVPTVIAAVTCKGMFDMAKITAKQGQNGRELEAWFECISDGSAENRYIKLLQQYPYSRPQWRIPARSAPRLPGKMVRAVAPLSEVR